MTTHGESGKPPWSRRAGPGFVCDRCGDQRYSPTHNGRRLWRAKGCGYQNSSIVGSVVEHTKAALDDVVSGLRFLSQSKSGISALALKAPPGGGLPTAWLLAQAHAGDV